MKHTALGIVLLALIAPSHLQTCSKEDCEDTIVAVIGPTGVGKSSFCNLISGVKENNNQTYPVCDGIDSCTYNTTSKRVRWMGNEPELLLLDTPGLGDSEGRDTQHILEMTNKLRELKYVNTFLIMFNAANPRLDEYLQAQLKLFENIFGSGFFENVILVFNRWEYSSKAEKKRRQTSVNKQSLAADFNHKFRKLLGVKHTVNAYFIDTLPDQDDPKEIDAVNSELAKMHKEILQKLPFKCEDIEAMRGFVDNLTSTIEEKDNDIKASNEKLKEKEKEILESEQKLKEERIRNEEKEASRERERKKEEERERKKEEENWWWDLAKVGAGVAATILVKILSPIPLPI